MLVAIQERQLNSQITPDYLLHRKASTPYRPFRNISPPSDNDLPSVPFVSLAASSALDSRYPPTGRIIFIMDR